MNWRGKPLTSHEVIVNTIAATTTGSGLRVHAELDTNTYPTGVTISDTQLAGLPITRHDWHGDWNYTLRPDQPDPGTPRCRCHADPPQLHGPYWQWTAKVNGKTVTRRLSETEAKLYQEWISNDRQLRKTITKMRQIAAKASELMITKASRPVVVGSIVPSCLRPACRGDPPTILPDSTTTVW